jgi:D-glycero-alpha-D-manno-heptose-7-phosphate kinase
MPTIARFISTGTEDAIITTAPCRADLAGGTLDIWPLYLFHPGAMSVNIALNIRTACRITPRPGREIILKSYDTAREHRFSNLKSLQATKKCQHPLAAYLVRYFQPKRGFLLETFSQSPAGAGISGSSALMIATASALARFTCARIHIEQIRVIAQNIEAQLIRFPTGCQDYYPAMYGGVSAIHLKACGICHESIAIPLDEIDDRFVLFYTGAPRQSGINNWEVFKQHINGNQRVIRNFEEISQIAQAMRRALASRRWADVQLLMREEWKLRRTNAPGITTPLIDKLIAASRRRGGLAAKVCGAGGGGCVIVLVEPGSRSDVERAIRENGGQPLNFRVARQGLTFHPAAEQRNTNA